MSINSATNEDQQVDTTHHGLHDETVESDLPFNGGESLNQSENSIMNEDDNSDDGQVTIIEIDLI